MLHPASVQPPPSVRRRRRCMVAYRRWAVNPPRRSREGPGWHPQGPRQLSALSAAGTLRRPLRSPSRPPLAALIPRVYSSLVNKVPCPGRPETVMMLLRTAERVERMLERALEGIGLSPAKLAVLGGLAAAGGRLSLGELAQHRSCVKSNITKLIDRLEADGLVARMDDPTDRRGVLAE